MFDLIKTFSSQLHISPAISWRKNINPPLLLTSTYNFLRGLQRLPRFIIQNDLMGPRRKCVLEIKQAHKNYTALGLEGSPQTVESHI